MKNYKRIVLLIFVLSLVLLLSACELKIPAFSKSSKVNSTLDAKYFGDPVQTETAETEPTKIETTEAELAKIESIESVQTKNESDGINVGLDNTLAHTLIDNDENAILNANVNATQTRVEIVEKRDGSSTINSLIGSGNSSLNKYVEAGIASSTQPSIISNGSNGPVGTGPSGQDDPYFSLGWYNPATAYCLEKGGKSKPVIIPGDDQYALCQFNDGTECEEWSFYYSKCLPGQFTKYIP